jgi:hypothetical protein
MDVKINFETSLLPMSSAPQNANISRSCEAKLRVLGFEDIRIFRSNARSKEMMSNQGFMFRYPAGKRFLYLVQRVLSCSVDQPNSYSLRIGDFFSRGKTTEV